jgi:hypothetical protein
MILRYGFYEGQVKAGRTAAFDAHFETFVIPALATMPGVVRVRLLRGIEVGEIQPRFHHIIELTFHDEEGLLEAMRSEQRRAIQAGQWGVMDFYDGATPHANLTVALSLDGPAEGLSAKGGPGGDR